MQSHDFASTYVGTPFYMSPEICAAEKYTLHSDIWAVGCIMYELCQKAPPFNAKTHIQLVQKIREGKPAPLPDFYSSELKSVIASCLRVNPDHRPDTAAILNLPIVRLMRKEREVVDLGAKSKQREEAAIQKMKELELRYSNFEKEKAIARDEIENTVRREWEVKARLEIDRQAQAHFEKLKKQFDIEVQARVAAELEKLPKSNVPEPPMILQQPMQHHSASASSVSASEDSDFPSTTDLSELSLESPTSSRNKPPRKGTRTPFSRAKTTVESPVDIQMGEPSPISIASLSLSPRRTAAVTSSKNLFAEQTQQNKKWEPSLVYSDDDEDIPDLPSPTRPKVRPDPFKAPRRPLLRQQTAATMQKLSSQPTLFPAESSRLPPPSNSIPTQPETRQTIGELRSKSPNRRLSKIPSSSNLAGDATSPTRKGAGRPLVSKTNGSTEDMFKAVLQRNMGGRTLVELAQARAGGRPVDDVKRASSDSRVYTEISGYPETPATWDPNSEQMPSPFVARRVVRSIR
jgi:NIMA (never in mitosis gene a)-related kinase